MPAACSCARRFGQIVSALRLSGALVPELTRFLLAGLLSTIVNLSVLTVLSYSLPYRIALICGLFAGYVASFLLAKLFTFRAHTWTAIVREAAMFTAVYVGGSAVYWLVAIATHDYVYAALLPHPFDKLAGALTGASAMALTSYAGHRLLTFKTSRNAAARGGPR